MLIFYHFSLFCSCFFPVLEIIFDVMSFQYSSFYAVIAIDGTLGLSCNLYKQFFLHLVFPPKSSINTAHVPPLIDHFYTSHADVIIFPANQTAVVIVCQMFLL